MKNQVTERITLWGIVQGVGFRPFVAKLADRMNMKGFVLNIGGLVEITVTDSAFRIDDFVRALQTEKPDPAEIVHIRRTRLEPVEFTEFKIVSSDEGGDEAAMIPPDMAICPRCLEELYQESDPRHQHPFISCMLCGPRYTIIDKIPYDRENTTMSDYPMCGFCQVQYDDLEDRRHHAQTISCHVCGPFLKWKEHAPDGRVSDGIGPSHETENARHTSAHDRMILDHAAEILADGGVIAFKSVGGYNLVADPFNEDAVRKLRKIKGREEKPFALMFRDRKEISWYCNIDETEGRLLESSARPILLLEHKLEDPDFAPMANRRFPERDHGTPAPSFTDMLRSRFIGAFLPSLGAQYLLLDRISPLIFTSANTSDLPMITDDAEMLDWFRREMDLDGLLYNERRILTGVDDSVCRVIDGQPQMIRRSKGYAPLPLYAELPAGAASFADSVFAAGGQLKNSFALSKGPFFYMSQYIGDLDTVENQQRYHDTVCRMSDLFRIRPKMVVCDMHPLYETTRYAEEYASFHSLPLLKVQHHHAHVASVMAENDLQGPVIGVSFDGTGYGTDGAIWGGEILLCEGAACERISHLKYVNMIGGDSSIKDARRSAFSYMTAAKTDQITDRSASPLDDSQGCRQFVIDISDILKYGSERMMGCPDAQMILRALETNVNNIRSSSMGRLFDAVAALLDIREYNDYEGQCACMLEDAAAFAQKYPGKSDACDMALAFHERVIDAIIVECCYVRELTGASQVALTGGTFQNRILMEGTLARLRRLDFKPYYNISVSPNDGGIALGQAYVGMQAAVKRR